MSLPNVVMNSLVSPTKVITNDVIPNPIVAQNPISLPISLPVTSIGVPMMNVKTDNDKLHTKSNDLDAIDTEDEKFSDTKKSDESMPVEDDSIIEMAHKIEENIGEADVEVTEIAEPIEVVSETTKSDDSTNIEQSHNKSNDLSTMGEHLNATEPMECASVNSMTSPKHTMTTDVIMAESVSVIQIIMNRYEFSFFNNCSRSDRSTQTSSTGSMQVESSDTSLTSNTDMHDIVEK